MSDQADFLLRRLRIRHVQLLAMLADKGSVRAAATAMHLSQPAVSKMLTEVEAAFGERLFERDRSGVVPNAYGRAAIHRSRVVLSELQVAAQEMESIRGGGGLLRVGTLSITDLMPVAVVGLLAKAPGARIQIHEARVQELIKLLLDGELDCVFGALSPSALESTPIEELTMEVIMQDCLCVLMSPHHSFANKRRLNWSEVHDLRWVAPMRSTVVRQAFISAFTNRGLPPPLPVVEVTSPVTLRAILAADPGLAGVVRFESGRQAAALAGLRLLKIEPQIGLPPLCFFTRKGHTTPLGIVQIFHDELMRAASTGKTPKGAR